MRMRPELTAMQNGSLLSAEGELVIVRIAVNPRRLEQLLEALALVPFPVNPEIYHNIPPAAPGSSTPGGPLDTTIVEFPAYSGRLPDVCNLLNIHGFDPASVSSQKVLERIRTGVSAQSATGDAGCETERFRKPASAGD